MFTYTYYQLIFEFLDAFFRGLTLPRLNHLHQYWNATHILDLLDALFNLFTVHGIQVSFHTHFFRCIIQLRGCQMIIDHSFRAPRSKIVGYVEPQEGGQIFPSKLCSLRTGVAHEVDRPLTRLDDTREAIVSLKQCQRMKGSNQRKTSNLFACLSRL